MSTSDLPLMESGSPLGAGNVGVASSAGEELANTVVASASSVETGRAAVAVVSLLRIGRYEIEREIARGGMGVVYQAYDRELDRRAALKIIKSGVLADAQEIERFQVEAQAAARLDHPGIVPVFEVGRQDGQQFLAMAFVDGQSLWDRVKEAPLEADEAARIMQQVAAAVQSAHDRGIVHRDLKPQNILLTKDGRPRVTDFGLAKLQESNSHLTETGQTLGTPGFMPPEQAKGVTEQIGPLSDVYSLGATLYCLLTGRPPFQAANKLDTLLQVVEQSPVPPRQFNPRIPVDLETICLKCLEKSPAQRYPTAAEMADELGRFLRGEPIQARPLSYVHRCGRWCQRNPVVSGLAATLMTSLLIGTAVSIYFALLAGQRAVRAEEGTRIAVETLESVVFQMQEKLQSIPAAREARKEILSKAMEELQKLSQMQVQSQRVDIGTAVVLVRFATLIMDAGADAKLGTLATAEANLQRASEIYARCSADDPANIKIRSDWAFALMKGADLAVTMKNPARARELIPQSLALYEQLQIDAPDKSADWTKQRSQLLAIKGDLLEMSGDLSGAQAAFREAKQLALSLRSQDPDNSDYVDLLIFGLEKEADVTFAIGDIPAARELYVENLKLNQDYLNSSPTDPIRMMSVSICYERMGDFESHLGRDAVALDYFEREFEITLQAIEADPKNQRYRDELRTAISKLSQQYAKLNRGEEAGLIEKRVQERLAKSGLGNQP
ncbi:serine/threonine protein kinase [Planctomicrobium piriforme]|nr:serine/threonine-protein kinase [Planctomicrobium piriforme]